MVVFLVASIATAAGAGCVTSEEGERTQLNPEGPPMVRQVFLNEAFTTNGATRRQTQLAFGSHPDVEDADGVDGVNTAAARADQKIRIVLDELLLGSYLEEVECFPAEGSMERVFSRIPPEATPDDFGRCLPPELTNCTGPNAICVVDGEPLGILDLEQNGGADNWRMIRYPDGNLAVRLFCDGGDGNLTGDGDDIYIPLNQEESFWNPTGNQLLPANPNCGIDCLGPAIVLFLEDGMRTGSQCGISFQEEVIDKDLNQVCAPADGDIGQACSPGDTSLISWTVEPLRVTTVFPQPDAMGVNVNAELLVAFNTSIDTATLDEFLLIEDPDGAATVVDVAWTLAEDSPLEVQGAPAAPLTADTVYEIQVPTTVTDRFGGALPEAFISRFTTAP